MRGGSERHPTATAGQGGESATQYQRFLDEVQRRARLASPEDARQATQATLTSLAERLTPGAADDLAAQLPPEIGRFLRGQARANPAPSLDEWLATVAEREHRQHQDQADAAAHARAVMAVLREAVSPGQVRNIEAQLPDDFRELWRAGADGRADR